VDIIGAFQPWPYRQGHDLASHRPHQDLITFGNPTDVAAMRSGTGSGWIQIAVAFALPPDPSNACHHQAAESLIEQTGSGRRRLWCMAVLCRSLRSDDKADLKKAHSLYWA